MRLKADPPRLNEEQKALVRKWQRLAVNISRSFSVGKKISEDLLQQAYLGLCLAAMRFEPDRGYVFATYAQYWVRAMLYEYVVRTSGPVYIGNSRNSRKLFFGLSRARRFVEKECGGEAPLDRIAARLGVEEDAVAAMIVRRESHDISFDYTRDDMRPFEVSDGRLNPDEEFTNARNQVDAKKVLDHAMKCLNEKERRVIAERYLKNEDDMVTLQALADKFGLSRERVRQIEMEAFRKLRRKLGAGETS